MLEIDTVSLSKLPFFRGCMDEFAVKVRTVRFDGFYSRFVSDSKKRRLSYYDTYCLGTGIILGFV